MRIRSRFIPALAVPLLSLPLAGALAPGTEARIEVTITEGTNLAAALSPDGSTIALDLLGRIWTMPAEGGVATPLTDPFGDARQPRWSPDGDRIVFQAYWGGDYDVWSVGADGSGLSRLTWGPFDDREPSWSPDGSRILFSSDRAGSYDIWALDPSSGAVTRLSDGPDNEYTPDEGPDGRVAWMSDGAGGALVVQGPNGGPTRLVELDGVEGYSPSWSPDGASIAWVGVGNGASGLHVTAVDGSGGAGRRVTGEREDVFPFRASWARDGSLLYTGDGLVRRVPSSGGAARDVGFSATVTLERAEYRKRLRSFEPEGPRPVQGIVSPALAPDGGTVAFAALGDLWLMRIGEAPTRLTDDAHTEVDPAWSPDGTRLVYASSRAGGTDLWLHDVATGAERRLTTDGGSAPAWSPDGREIAYLGGGRGGGLRVLDVATGQARTVRSGLNGPGRPTWSPDGRSVVVAALWRYSTRFREGVNRALRIPTSRPISEQGDGEPGDAAGHGGAGVVETVLSSVPQEGERWRDFSEHGSVSSRGTDGPVWSPDGRSVAFVAEGVLWVAPVEPSGDPAGPPRRLNNEFSSDPSWSGDGRSILYLSDAGLRRIGVEDGRVEAVPVPLDWSGTVPGERWTLHAGQLFDGVGTQIRRSVDVVISGNRIVRVVPHDASLHGGRVIHASDGIIAPGLLDTHKPVGLDGAEQGGRQWLAFGVTSVRSPATDPFEVVEARESRASGRRIGPRVFGTGNTLDGSRIYYAGAPALASGGQIELEMDLAGALGFDFVKTYVRLSDPMQHRVIDDAHALGMPVTSHELYPAVAVGVDGVEHVRGTSRRGYSPKVSELNRSYQDVVALLVSSGAAITPTVGIYGGNRLVGWENPELFDDRRVRAFAPGAAAPDAPEDPEVLRTMVRDMASLGRRVAEEGGAVIVGTDTGPAGLSLLQEMQILVEYGGMAEIDVLRGVTSAAADALGYGHALGAVREGMLADLVVLGSDPLRDIRAVRDVRLVVADGRPHTIDALLAGEGR